MHRGETRTPAGWLIFRHLGIGRGICQDGSTIYPGLNGGMRDAIEAWPDFGMIDRDGAPEQFHDETKDEHVLSR